MVTITGNLASMQVEQNAGVGIQFDNGPHRVVFTSVIGDGIDGTSTDGVVVGPTATGILLDSVVVKEHGGDGFVIDGASARIVSSSVDRRSAATASSSPEPAPSLKTTTPKPG